MTPEERLDRIEKSIIGLTEINKACIGSIQTLTGAVDQLRDMIAKDHINAEIEMKNLRAAQLETDDRLNILLNTVDRIIRFKNGGT